jgi:hypothetical protein
MSSWDGEHMSDERRIAEADARECYVLGMERLIGAVQELCVWRCPFGRDESLDSVIARADRAMYERKRARRKNGLASAF